MSRLCKSCRVSISPERLNAIPAAEQCRLCVELNGDIETPTDNYITAQLDEMEIPVPSDEDELSKEQEYALEEVGFVHGS